ncbi:MAG: TonB-dependent receptor [Vicinamibacterales bacterium]
MSLKGSLCAIALLLVTPVRAAATPQASPDAPCRLRVSTVDPDGRAVRAVVHLVDSTAPAVTTEGAAACVPLEGAAGSVRLLVSAEGFQPYATDAIELLPGAARELVVTLVRHFADSLSVVGRAANLIGVADSASSGVVGAADLAGRPLARTGDLLEAVPGVAMTQHSSGGHAPIVLLRGYNLDHGTDFATSFEGVPLNLPSHAHAQGYTDANFLIEDVVQRIEFEKGPYSAGIGNFGTAGAARIELADRLAEPSLRVEAGSYGFRRVLGLGSFGTARHRLMLAGEASHDDGPSEVPDDFGRVKAIARYSTGSLDGRHLALTYAGYRAAWTATDGYPRRALLRGDVSRFGTLDPTDGGRSQQHLLVLTTRAASTRQLLRAGAFLRYYDLDLFSNLTFWTRSPDGDQIGQADRRVSAGGSTTVSRSGTMAARHVDITGGIEVRHDAGRVRLVNTQGRIPLPRRDMNGTLVAPLREDARIAESAAAPHGDIRVQVAPWMRASAGVRLDAFRMRVRSRIPENSGTTWSAIASPKLTTVFGPWRGAELYANAGLGFHSNHALGVRQQIDLDTGTAARLDGTPVVPADPLVRTRGAETGVRVAAGTRLRSSVALWMLESGSELVYTAEDGVTSPERPGQRRGIEWLNVVSLSRTLQADLDVAWSHARYRTDPRGEGRLIPDAARAVVGWGVTLSTTRVGAALRGRYVGSRPLDPSGAQTVDGAFLLNGSADLRLGRGLHLVLAGFNLLGRVYEDTAYYYATRLRDPRTGMLEPAPVDDQVTHPGQPRTVRVGMRVRF